jgi:glycosyltransferase involved in cell wall biosynthesis
MDSADTDARPRRIAVVGISPSATCGVRDHARLLARELAHEHVECELHWLTREARSPRGSRLEIQAWTRRLAAELREGGAEAILLHYSVFSYAYKGVPVFVRPTLAALRAPGVPVLAFMHELAYPWGHGGVRGRVWAFSQRVALRELVRACAGVIVTADFRATWVRAQRWLAPRPLRVAPVFSTLPAPSTRALARAAASAYSRAGEPATIGVFGYSYEGAAANVVLEAVRALRDRGARVQLSLLGAPGRASAAGEAWSATAEALSLVDALGFSGTLPVQELSDALSACTVLVFADLSGPSSRKTTLAASLASGVPVVALEGPRGWSALARDGAARVVAPHPGALGEAIAELLGDDAARLALGARGRGFAEREMSAAASARSVATLLEELLSPRSGG